MEKGNTPTTQFPHLFEGLGKLEGEYSIQLEEGAQPFAVHTPRRVPIPMLAQVAGSKFFSKLDANSGFWQIPLSPDSSLLTTFITPFGRFCFRRLPFGITSAPEHFQRRMQEILEGLDGIAGLTDDILVHGKTQEEHDQRLQKALQRISDAHLTLNKEKCLFSVNWVKFWGHIIDQYGIHPDPEKVSAITNVPQPKDVGGIRRFLGMANQLGKFVPHMAEVTAPL